LPPLPVPARLLTLTVFAAPLPVSIVVVVPARVERTLTVSCRVPRRSTMLSTAS
jgi:hypothetical protein